jgi:hypothetical protein
VESEASVETPPQKVTFSGLKALPTPVDSAPGNLEDVRFSNVTVTIRATSIKFGDDEPYSLKSSETPELA